MTHSSAWEAAKRKIVLDPAILRKVVEAQRTLGHVVVVTIGSWDMLHIGHLRYLMEARHRGDILVVGVDSDAAIKRYKGPLRPIIPQEERMEMLCYQGCVGYVTLVEDVNESGEWQYGLLDLLFPDVFVAVEDSYPEVQLAEIAKRCGEKVVLPRQAANTSSSDIIQNAIKGHVAALLDNLVAGRRA